MKTKTLEIFVILFFGLLAVLVLLAGQPVHAARFSADNPPDGEQLLSITEHISETVLTLNISNEAPGYLIDSLIAQGHGDETLFEVLGYLKAQSGDLIPDEFYNDVANAPLGSSVFVEQLSDWEGIQGSVEISADGSVHIRSLQGSYYANLPGYGTAPSQDGRFNLTNAQDDAYNIYTGSMQKQVGLDTITFNYYAFAIAWGKVYRIHLPLMAHNMISCFHDDFSNPGSGWQSETGNGWSTGYLNGEYQIQITKNDTYATGTTHFPLPIDYRLEVDARLASGSEGAYGLLFSLEPGDGQQDSYLWTVSPAWQAYRIERLYANGSRMTLVEATNSVIASGSNTNRLHINRIGSSIHAYINNVLVATFDDDTYIGAGVNYALFAYNYGQDPVDIRFDNFTACSIALSNPLFVDGFSESGRWYEADHGWGQFSYQSDEYEILIRSANSWGYATAPLAGGLPRYAVEVDARFATSVVGSYGLIFGRVDDSHFYNLRIYPGSQQYRLLKRSASGWTTLITYTSSAAINAGATTNQLRVERDGDQIKLYVNDILLNSLVDSSYLGNLGVGLYASSYEDLPLAVRYDNFCFSELP